MIDAVIITAAGRALCRLEVDGDCWIWPGARSDGYGQISVSGRRFYVHRAVYEALVGPVPQGLQLDHLCRRRECANPAHLEPVTAQENQLRGMGVSGIAARRDRCIHGHEFSRRNARGRVCQTCKNASARRRRLERAAA